MFQRKELELLRLQKKQLALKSDLNRLKLISDWQQVRSPNNWLNEGISVVKRHPVVAAAIATASGVLVTKVLKQSVSGFGRVGRIASMAVTAWKLFQRTRRENSKPES